MKINKLHIFAAISTLLGGCASQPKEPIVAAVPSITDSTRIDRGIDTAQRALPTAIDASRQHAHYQHVYMDSLSDAAESLRTLPLADAVANDVLASSDKKVRRFDLESDKLAWVVFDHANARPSEIEGVGGFGVDSENLSEVNFDLNETVIINPDRLDKLIEKARRVSGSFYIVGYADESGIEAKNYLLSQDRSNSVSAYLSKHNVHPSRIKNYGAGISHLYSGLDKNRRASVSFLIDSIN